MILIIMGVIQFFFSVVIGMYFLSQLKKQNGNKGEVNRDSMFEVEKLRHLREIKLTEPLSEKTRPKEMKDIVGQEEGIRALRAALCGPNPQHVLIYGPPGIGKTAAARIILEEAKKTTMSPFSDKAKFIEMDATTLRFDERNIADPLIGSVHDPIYQGAGSYGNAGIPQPKPGAVTKAHGGVLFLDEIGELHPIQMNKLLKVLEDRKVMLESAYYQKGDRNIPIHIHDIFTNGLPADFRLVGATTRSPEDISPALRSRCIEIYFRPLTANEVIAITKNAAIKGAFDLSEGVDELVAQYASNGRDAVNIVQIAGSLACIEKRRVITVEDIEWVIGFGKHCPRIENRVGKTPQIGLVNGLAVYGKSQGVVMEIEVTANKAIGGIGKLSVTGIIEQEETSNRGQKLKRNSTARASVQNMLTVMWRDFGIDTSCYDLHINFPGGMPVDGPSAGIAIFTAVFSAIMQKPVPAQIAMTGEISIHGKVKPVGGVPAKIEAAKDAGAKIVYIPKENKQAIFEHIDIEVRAVSDIQQVISDIFGELPLKLPKESNTTESVTMLTASPLLQTQENF
ncbi:MAG: ATP-dependent protease LonB [Hyphomonadaceae bacterium]|nr:ATP-dependent protease LonB [Clostridia bacterium]